MLLRSTRWPGATTVAYNDKFSNIYIGDGLKSLGNPEQTFVLPSLPELQNEYTPAEGVTFAEANDPTVEEEKAFELSQKKAEEANKDAEDGDEDGGDAEEDD